MNGLSSVEAARRLADAGPNALPERPPEPVWRRFARQFHSPLIYILLCALAFDLGLWLRELDRGSRTWPVEAFTIALILVFNAGLGMRQEQRAEAALAKLKTLNGSVAWVFRDGRLVRVPTEALVPGDRVRIGAGDRVPADGVLAHVRSARLDESVLTGESLPVDKADGDEALSGTLMVGGRALLDVTRTGPASAMGRLASMLGEIRTSQAPLERRVHALGRRIARWVLALAVTLGLVGIAAEGLDHAADMIIFAVALAVAAVPEGLPAVLTVALAIGVERMARQRAVVRRLAAVEALGSVTVIATDKTGTLTESRMDVQAVDTIDEPHAIRAMALVNDADLATGAGDPLELGLLRHSSQRGVEIARVRGDDPIVSARPFDSAAKFARVTVASHAGPVSYLKGAPEVLFERCRLSASERQAWDAKADAYARDGLRVIALAWAEGERESDLSLLGLVTFWDPPRPEVPAAVAAAQAAGIRVIMITGDHPVTAAAIAKLVGIPAGPVLTGADLDRLGATGPDSAWDDTFVFARVRPEQKLQLVERLQARGEIVAMTGDGVNDAPALKRSDVGVAMGIRGSDVSREVADIVLLDDNFATIVGAVEEGRGIYENIQTFLRFLLSTNLSEVLLVACGAVLAFSAGLRDAAGALMLPLTAVQILWINLVTDGLPAVALAFDRTPDVRRQPPRRPDAPLLDRASVRFVVSVASIQALLGLALLGWLPRVGYPLDVARAATFHFMAIGQLLLTYPSRISGTRPLSNRYLHAAVLGSVTLQIVAAAWPLLAKLLGHAAMPIELWLAVFGAAAVSWAAGHGFARRLAW